ncbi:MAG: plastocyanin/azurin family copper-binding protein [Candidatus Thermoplasmatota archaeon]|nr:plastocyanin/azurin family copper-binding protein [Candidatus Thermoplasmatota archaeon]MEC7410001.1 plastocyanin/azurin family copper-binding protein [Candidatus Thermoplasmatota archaeon]
MRTPVILSLLLCSFLLTGSIGLEAQHHHEEADHVLATTITVDSTNLRFSPPDVTISEGDTVRFLWSGELLPHNAVEAGGVFDSGEPSRNVDYIFTFEIGMTGTYEYVCEPHEDMGMVGSITVEPMNTTEEEEPSVVEKEETDDRNLPHPLLSGLASLALASIFPNKRRSRIGE